MGYIYSLSACVLLFIAGFPASDFISKKYFSKNHILGLYLALPLGVAIIAIPLNIIVAMNIPLLNVCRLLSICLIVFFIFYWWKFKFSYKILDIMIFIAFITIIILLQGYSYFSITPDYYIGNRALDSLFYVENPQALIYFPLHMGIDEFPNNPWLTLPTVLNPHRISVTTVQAFLSVAMHGDTLKIQGFMMMLPSILIFCGMRIVLSKQSKIHAFTISLLAAVLPCITNLFLEGFLGAVSCIPFFLLSVYFFNDTLQSFNKGKVFLTIIFVNLTVTTYTDTFFILAGILCISCAFHILKRRDWKRCCMVAGAVIVGILILNIFYVKSIFINELFMRDATSFNLSPVYNNIHDGAFFTELFFGSTNNKFLILLSILLYFSAIIGSAMKYFKTQESLHICTLALILAPWVFVGRDETNVYLFYRISVIISPFIILGIFSFFQLLMNLDMTDYTYIKKYQKKVLTFSLIIVTCLSFYYSWTRHINCILQMDDRVSKLTDEDVQNFDTLSNMTGENIYYVSYPSRETYWAFYYGRNNNFWLNDKSLNQRFEIGSWFDKADKEEFYDSNYTFSYNRRDTIPSNVKILYDERYKINFTDPSLKSTVGMYFDSNGTVLVPGDSSKLFNPFFINVYSKEERDIQVNLHLTNRDNSLKSFEIEDVSNENVYNIQDSYLEVNLHLLKGNNSFYFRGNQAFFIKDVTVSSLLS